jgi:hypothetical protein
LIDKANVDLDSFTLLHIAVAPMVAGVSNCLIQKCAAKPDGMDGSSKHALNYNTYTEYAKVFRRQAVQNNGALRLTTACARPQVLHRSLSVTK